MVEKTAPSAFFPGSGQDHDATLHVVYRAFGDVRSTADVLTLVDQGPLPPG